MMKLFKGISFQTVQMKCKPIKEGFKFYALCDSTTGFVYFFIPDGMKDKHKGTVVDSIVRLVEQLPDRNIPSNDGKKRTYVVVMDNYFTYSSTLVRFREAGVRAFGTTRAT